jgi:protein SCO1
MKRPLNIWLFPAAVIALPLSVFALVDWYESSVQKLPVLIGKEHRIANYQLTDENNNNFFFTHCPVVCPKMTRNLKQVQAAFDSNKKLLIVSFSVDPERDSAARLKEFAQRFSINEGNWKLLTGSKKEIYRLARKSFQVIATDGDGGPDDFIHSDQLILMDTQKRIRGYYNGTEEKEITQLIKDIKKLEHEN